MSGEAGGSRKYWPSEAHFVKSADPLRVLHVGVGNRGQWPLAACGKSENFASAALCDVSQRALAEARKQTGIGSYSCFQSLEQALTELGASLDCAIICSPTRFHVLQAELCLKAGLSVLVEKGMAPGWYSACHLVAAAREAKGRACVAQNYRYNSVEQTVRQALSDPEHPAHPGRVHQVTYNQQRVRPEPRTLDYPFASVWDMSCHHFDTLSFWFGALSHCTAFAWQATWSAYQHASNTSAHLEYENGVVVHYLHTHDAARAGIALEIHGERGCLSFTQADNGDSEVSFSARPAEQFAVCPRSEVPLAQADGEAALLQDCHAYFSGGQEPGVSVSNNLETMAACEMMVRSIKGNRRVSRRELDA